jgi:exopolysaccharide biosynthesis polyprenyl glycosylphosphotransferase
MAGNEQVRVIEIQERPAVQRRRIPLSHQQRTIVITLTLLLGDGVLLAAAFILAYVLRFEVFLYQSIYRDVEYVHLAIWSIPAWLAIFAIYQLYHSNTLFGGLREYTRVFSAVTMGIMLIIVVDFIFRGSTQISRGWLILYWLLTLTFIEVWRFSFRRLVYMLRQRGHLLSPAVIVGANAEGAALAEQLHNQNSSGLYLMGFIDGHMQPGTPVSKGYRVLGGLDELERAIADGGVQDVIIAHTALERDELLSAFRYLSQQPGVNIRLSSGLFEIITTGMTVKELAYVPLFEVNKTRISGLDALMKSVLDYGITLLGMVVLLPVFGLIAVLIKRETPGPALYRRRVMGMNGKEFDAFKFRTMRVDGDGLLQDRPELREELARNFKLKDDPRVTRFGGLLRKYSIDEMPQLFNVLRGEMSLVGPRMISPPEMEKYGKWGMNLLTVKPGLTGLWQVSGRSDVSYEDRVQMDMQYIRNWSIWLDIYLILATFPAVIKKKGAY